MTLAMITSGETPQCLKVRRYTHLSPTASQAIRLALWVGISRLRKLPVGAAPRRDGTCQASGRWSTPGGYRAEGGAPTKIQRMIYVSC